MPDTSDALHYELPLAALIDAIEPKQAASKSVKFHSTQGGTDVPLLLLFGQLVASDDVSESFDEKAVAIKS